MRLQTVLDKIIASKPCEWHRVRQPNADPDPFRLRVAALQGGDDNGPGLFAADKHTDYAVLTSDVAITLTWGMTAAGRYHEPWASRCPDPAAWTGYFDVAYHGILLHRDVFVSIDGDRYYLPLPRNLDDLRVPADYAQVTALLSALSLDADGSDLRVYLGRTGLVLADMPWPMR
jgi:hypothetical protein